MNEWDSCIPILDMTPKKYITLAKLIHIYKLLVPCFKNKKVFTKQFLKFPLVLIF